MGYFGMPKQKEISDAKISQPEFYTYVLTYYRNDPYLMLDSFADKIAAVAAEVSIDWYETRHNVSLDSEMVKGRGVCGFESADRGRISVIAFENSFSFNDDKGGDYTINFPSIRFNNYRKHFNGPVIFDGFKALHAEYKRHQNGERTPRVVSNSAKREQYLARTRARQEEEKLRTTTAVESDYQWLQKLRQLTNPCEYFFQHGCGDLYTKVALYTGSTVKGIAGRFTALPLMSVKNWNFAGLLRIYPEHGEKIFRKGLNPSHCVFPIPGIPINGEPIYVMEGAADAGVSFLLTGFCSVSALFADNIVNVVMSLREQFPDSDIIMVADNDQYGNSNKGISVCEEALMKTPGKTYLLIPEFNELQKKSFLKDLSDFFMVNGQSATVEFLLSYKAKK